jgi:hypothetical protein
MWWPLVKEFWRAGCGRKAAVAAIGPLVERSRSRLGGIPEGVWLDPYMIGFLVTLITLIAKREAQIYTDSGLAHVQSSAWAAITGMREDFFGEQVVALSASSKGGFSNGVHNALIFAQALYGGALADNDDDSALWERVSCGPPLADNLGTSEIEAREKEDSIAELWAACFESQAVEFVPQHLFCIDPDLR